MTKSLIHTIAEATIDGMSINKSKDMSDIVKFTAMTILQVVKDGISTACVGVEADNKEMEKRLAEDGVFCVDSYLTIVGAGVAAIIQTAWKDKPEEQAAYVHRFFEIVEAWIKNGIELTNAPEIPHQPESTG